MENAQMVKECESLRRDVKQLQNEKQQLEKKLAQAVAKATKAATELKTELDTNAILRDDQQKWAAHVQGLEQKLKEVTETKDKVSESIWVRDGRILQWRLRRYTYSNPVVQKKGFGYLL